MHTTHWICRTLKCFVVAAFALATASAFAQANEGDPGRQTPRKPPPPAVRVGTTLENLQAAYNGESNARARYLEFAKKADEEGYAPLASLFRAAARAEQVHAEAHAAVITALGGKPEAKIEKPEVKSTRENLEAALAGETYEKQEMYPAFIKKARQERRRDAVRSFDRAKTAEAGHARLYADALENLDQWKGKDGKRFYVCSVCGYTVDKLDFENCVSCRAPKEKYEAVS